MENVGIVPGKIVGCEPVVEYEPTEFYLKLNETQFNKIMNSLENILEAIHDKEQE